MLDTVYVTYSEGSVFEVLRIRIVVHQLWLRIRMAYCVLRILTGCEAICTGCDAAFPYCVLRIAYLHRV